MRQLFLASLTLALAACSSDALTFSSGVASSTAATMSQGAGGASQGSGGGAETSALASTGAGEGGFQPSGSGGADPGPCVDPLVTPKPAAPEEAALAPAFAQHYAVYDLGTPPGMPAGHLGGSAVLASDPNHLVLVGQSETPSAGLYRIGVKRDACGHIAGWEGSATLLASTPYADASLVELANQTLLYSQWPVARVGQLLPGAKTPSADTALGVMDSPGGLALVPSYLKAAGELRALGWPNGTFFHVAAKPNGALLELGAATPTKTLGGGPGAFAYVPPDSPGFDKPSMLVAEWTGDQVGAYAVDAQGEPLPESRVEFFSKFVKPWGAHFEPKTGDYLFLTWSGIPDKVFVVRGFAPPPPPPTPK